MHSIGTLGTAWKDLRTYTKSDTHYVLFLCLAIVVLLVVSIVLLPTRRDLSGHIVTPAGLRFLSFIVGLIGALVFLTLTLRSFASLRKKQLDSEAVLKSLFSYIGPIVVALISDLVYLG